MHAHVADNTLCHRRPIVSETQRDNGRKSQILPSHKQHRLNSSVNVSHPAYCATVQGQLSFRVQSTGKSCCTSDLKVKSTFWVAYICLWIIKQTPLIALYYWLKLHWLDSLYTKSTTSRTSGVWALSHDAVTSGAMSGHCWSLVLTLVL